jgi:hypothetical protein
VRRQVRLQRLTMLWSLALVALNQVLVALAVS